MRILVAEDDRTTRKLMEGIMQKWGFEVLVKEDGRKALEALCMPNAPRLAILDWMMPGMDGVDICRTVREREKDNITPFYFILLTSKDRKEDIVEGLHAGANDYIIKPFNMQEFHARVKVGQRVVELQEELCRRVRELEEALRQVKTLRSLLPICAWCKKVRDDLGYWQQIEGYIREHTDADFTHTICPECHAKMMSKE